MSAPRATYRLQLRPGFGFQEAAGIADYLARLGVSHLYSSPYLQAAPGSTHGYDVVDHRRVNRELGGEEGHARFCEALGTAGLGQLLDLVPNHMAITGPENEWWWDVLKNGPSSPYAAWFDVDWEPPEEKLRDLVLLPVLPDHYGRVLEDGWLEIVREGAEFTVRYRDLAYPLSPRSVDTLVERATGRRPNPSMPASSLALDPEVGEALDQAIREINGDPDLLDAILDQQHYRLAYWRTGNRELDYRRFFDVDSLAALRVEDPEVFAATHGLVLSWVRKGVLDGLRIDHIDGLRRPREYLERMRAEVPEGWLLVEKVLEAGEVLRPSWPVDGTTGYDFLNDVGCLFVDPRGEEPLNSLYVELTGDDTPWEAVVQESKELILDRVLASDLNRLTQLFVQICEGNRRFRDFTRHQLREVLRNVAVSFPVYRTYVEEGGAADPADQEILDRAFRVAEAATPDLDPELFGFLQSILSGATGSVGEAETELRMRFQQLTGPVMAKATEDTAFYRFARFIALNEVGGNPARFGVLPEAFHERCRRAAGQWPRSMLALSTHDTKRAEDVRARLFLLSEIPGRWGNTARRWMERSRRRRGEGAGPDPAAEYFLYQTLVGAHPLPLERAREYMLKAVREAKSHTSWTDPDPDYEEGLLSLLAHLYADSAFQEELEAFTGSLVLPGRITSLALKLVQLTAPGIPDTYQGTELWDLSLVDPDNRRPVDFELRRTVLNGLESASPEEILLEMERGDPKMWVIRQALEFRRERPELFGPGSTYRALQAEGVARSHVLAFLRGAPGPAVRPGGTASGSRDDRASVLTVVPRLILGLGARGGFSDTTLELPDGLWLNRLTGEETRGGPVRVSRLLERFPVALLARRSTA